MIISLRAIAIYSLLPVLARCKRVGSIRTEDGEVEISASFTRPDQAEEESVTITWVPMYCKTKTSPDLELPCDDYKCSITYEGDYPSYFLRPYMEQVWFSNCTDLANDLRGFDYELDYHWGVDEEAAMAKYGEIKQKLPYDGCLIRKLPEVENQDQWIRCVERPGRRFLRDFGYQNRWNQLTYATKFKNGTILEEHHIVPDMDREGLPSCQTEESLLKEEKIDRFIDVVRLERPCNHEILFLNKLPVAVTLRMQWTDGNNDGTNNTHHAVMEPGELDLSNQDWTRRRSWYSLVLTDRRDVKVKVSVVYVDGPSPITLDPEEMSMTVDHKASEDGCFSPYKLIDGSYIIV